MVYGFLKINLKSTYGYRVLSTEVNSRLRNTELPTYGSETYMIFFGTFGMAAVGLKILSKNALTVLLKINEG